MSAGASGRTWVGRPGDLALVGYFLFRAGVLSVRSQSACMTLVTAHLQRVDPAAILVERVHEMHDGGRTLRCGRQAAAACTGPTTISSKFVRAV